jgi:DNA-binding XRE family transcriptional regulator
LVYTGRMDSLELRRRRGHLQLTQEHLAHTLGVTRQTVYNWERHAEDGRPRELALGRMLALALWALEHGASEEGAETCEKPS